MSQMLPGDAEADAAHLETTLSEEMLLSSEEGEGQAEDIFLQLRGAANNSQFF